MKRLIGQTRKVFNIIANKQFKQQKHQILANCFKTILAFKLIAENNFTEEDFNIFKGLHNIAEYQLAGGNSEIRLTKENIFYNDIEQYFSKCIITSKAYRGLYLDKNKINKNNIEQSIKELIITGRLESWSKSKTYVDDKHFTSVPLPNGISVKITSTVTGIYLPLLWKEVKEVLYNENPEEFGNDYGDVDDLYNFEQEILAITPDNYEIYNLTDIKKEMEK